ncbi:MAG: methyltransferase domain-containing protein [Pyrinomonadaceae bacterium]
MCVVEKDFDRLALLDDEGWTHNNHYHNFLLRRVPANCREALEIGCGTGAFARRLAERAEHVTALDLSPEMIRVARSQSSDISNIRFQLTDVNNWDFPARHFDCISSIATLHHTSLREVLWKAKGALAPGGVLLVLDLFEPDGFADSLTNMAAAGMSGVLRLLHNGRLKPSPEVQAAWDEHGRHDSYLTVPEVKRLCAEVLPGARIRKHLFWRYSIVWQAHVKERAT